MSCSELDRRPSRMAQGEPVPLVVDAQDGWRAAGIRVLLETLVAAFQRGDSPEEIREQYPWAEGCLLRPCNLAQAMLRRASSLRPKGAM